MTSLVLPPYRALPPREGLERVCVLIADPPDDLAGLTVGMAIRLIHGVGRGLCAVVLDHAGVGPSTPLRALTDEQVDRLSLELQAAVVR